MQEEAEAGDTEPLSSGHSRAVAQVSSQQLNQHIHNLENLKPDPFPAEGKQVGTLSHPRAWRDWQQPTALRKGDNVLNVELLVN